jgi:NAD(P)-dependent dehydrogenase (short-subunit alcohol dehydrogenase family)
VALAGRRRDRLEHVAREISSDGGEALVLTGDVRSDATGADWVRQTVERFGSLHGLVNAAGVIAPGSAYATDQAEWDRVMDSNLRSIVMLTRAASGALIAARGNVVNISSVGGLRPYPNLAAYCVSKAAVDMYTRCAALDFAPHGVRVNAVNPGVVVTELHTVTNAVPDYAAFLERGKTTHPLGRVGQPEEVAALVLFLMSEDAGWITGVTYSIDGGRALSSAR